MGLRRDNPLRFARAHSHPVRASLPLLPRAVKPALPAKAGEAVVSHRRGWRTLAGLFLLSLLRQHFPPSQPYQRKETT